MMTFSSKALNNPKNTQKQSQDNLVSRTSQIQTNDNDLTSSIDDNEPAKNIHDIFAKRLRALKKRLQKIKRYEEILVQQETPKKNITGFKQLASQDPKSPSLSTCSLNEDQLNALKKKDYVLELVKEIEQLDLQVMEFERRNPKIHQPVQQSKKISQDDKDAIQQRQEVLMLWIALFRLEYIPASVLNREDSYAMRSLYALVHSILAAKDYKSGMQDLLHWMTNQEQSESTIQDLLPPYKVIKHCITKVLCAPLDHSRLSQTLSMSEVKDIIQKLQVSNTKQDEKIQLEKPNTAEITQSYASNNAFITPIQKESVTRQSTSSLSNVDNLTRGWKGIPADSAILRTGPMFSKERSNTIASGIPAYPSFPLSTSDIVSNIKIQPTRDSNTKGQMDIQDHLNHERPRRDMSHKNGPRSRRSYRGGSNSSSYHHSYHSKDDGEGSYE